MKIKDKCLEPYYIEVTENSFNVATITIDKKDKEVVNNLGYYSNLDTALRKIAKLKIIGDKTVVDLETYFNKLYSYLEEFKSKVNL